jgi:hypothetical protein
VFTGFVLGNLPPDHRHRVNPELTVSALTLLFRERNPLVRRKAAEAMALLPTY